MPGRRIGIIGAGMAGLSCARLLADAGHAPLVLDKGRGIGGRLATRRTADGLRFDHGAQYVTARGEGFQSLLTQMRAAGVADLWADGSGREHFVGVPGMNALARHLGAGLDIRQSIEVTSVARVDGGWEVVVQGEASRFDTMVVTVPAPQAIGLLGDDHPLSAEMAHVRITPCLALMATMAMDQPVPFTSRRDPDDPLAWIALDSSKPDRPGPNNWVAHAGPHWSAENLELDRGEIARRMLPMLCDRLGADPDAVRHAAAHRWRHASVAVPLGRPFLRDATGTLFLGGDWCLDARVEAAWTSGTAIARHILGTD